MKTQTVIEHFGTAARAARALGISKSAISQWGDQVPELRAYQIEAKTNGALKAEPERRSNTDRRASDLGNPNGPERRQGERRNKAA